MSPEDVEMKTARAEDVKKEEPDPDTPLANEAPDRNRGSGAMGEATSPRKIGSHPTGNVVSARHVQYPQKQPAVLATASILSDSVDINLKFDVPVGYKMTCRCFP